MIALLWLSLVATLVSSIAWSQPSPTIRAVPYASGFARPTNLVAAWDASGRLFVTEQRGLIRVVRNGQTEPDPLLDIRDRVLEIDPECCEERGLLGLAFPPDFAHKQVFYVNYTDRFGYSVTSRFRLGPDGSHGDAESEQVLLRLLWNSSN